MIFTSSTLSVESILLNANKNFHQGDYNNARNLCMLACQKSPTSFSIIYGIAILLSNLGEIKKAASYFEKAIAINPNYAEAYFNLGIIYQKTGKDKDAVESIYKAVELDDRYSSALFTIGLEFITKEKFDYAILSLKYLLKLQPEIAEVQHSLGLIYLTRNQLVSAEIAFVRAIELKPDYVLAYKNLARVMIQSEEYEKAVDLLYKAVTINPDCHDSWGLLGKSYRNTGDYDNALNAYEKEILLMPDKIECYNDLGLTYMCQGKLDKALECFQKVLRKSNMAEVQYNIGLVYQKQYKYQQAVESYNEALLLNPDNAAAHNNLGLVLKLMNKPSEAIPHYQKTVELDPGNIAAKHILAALTGRQLKTAAPEYVISLFDQYSDEFETELVRNLGYEVPYKLKDKITELLGDGVHFKHAVDLGCGTGICGQAFWPMSKKMTGVDLSPKMINKAEKKKVYDQLSQKDIIDFLVNSNDYFDLFVAADVFIYIGELENVFKSVKKRMLSDGYFTFSVERSNCDSYRLCSSGRYAHSRLYIEKLAEKNGFKIESCSETGIRKENDQWIEGDLYVLRSQTKQPEFNLKQGTLSEDSTINSQLPVIN
jgi:predicted TPR repeat methyltransferase